MNNLLKLLFVSLIFLFLAGCGEKSFDYEPIPDVPDEVNELGKRIGQEQRNVVDPGGNEANPGFSYDDRVKFEQSDKLDEIVEDVINSDTFREGVAAIRDLPPETRQMIYDRYRTPIYPTWAMNGEISDEGTTDAGHWVERQIANALTNAVIEAVGD